MLLLTFLLYLLAILLVGAISSRSTRTLGDFVLGGRRIGPWVTALSAEASDMSGWLLLGLPGAAYALGASVAWIALGLAMGTFANWFFVARRLRRETERLGCLTIPDYLEARFADERRHLLRIFSTILILLFYSTYISAQFVAAGKLMEATFGIPYVIGMALGAAVIVAYTMMGGFLAVCWTDLFQGILMAAGVLLLPLVAIANLGGVGPLGELLAKAGSDFLSLSGGKAGAGLFLGLVIGSLGWGLGYPGQPHILVRFMAIKNPRDLWKSLLISMVWVVLALGGAVLIGLCARAFFDPSLVGDRERVMPLLALEVFPPWLAGLLLSAAVAAMMSTVDSQMLVVVSTLVEDIYIKTMHRKPAEDASLRLGRLMTLLVGIAALLLALRGTEIFQRVMFTWSGLGASFAPVLVLSLFWRRMTRPGALAGMATGACVVLFWGNWKSFATDLLSNPIVPGFLAALAVSVVVSLAPRRKPPPAAEGAG